ncbi:MAG: diaminopimelate epimerase [Pseudomonadota bacterium]
MNRPRNTLTFFKMHGLGNDFMVMDRITQNFDLTPDLISTWGDRHTGIGFDQLLIIDAPTEAEADFWFRIYNTDGSEAQQCGNGTRAVAMLAKHLRLTKKNQLTWQSAAGTFHTTFTSAEQIETVMTVPVLEPPQVPFDAGHAELFAKGAVHQYQLRSNSDNFLVTPVSMGNPHGVLFVDDLFNTDVTTIGAALTAHPAFPEEANIGFCQVVDRQFIRLRVFERGVGETRACGSGACAAMVAANSLGKVDARVKVSLPGGKLRIKWPSPDAPVTMTGSATLVYRGELNDNSGLFNTGNFHERS